MDSLRQLKFWSVNILHLQGDVFLKHSILVTLHYLLVLGQIQRAWRLQCNCNRGRTAAHDQASAPLTLVRSLGLPAMRRLYDTMPVNAIFYLYQPCTLSSWCWFCVSTKIWIVGSSPLPLAHSRLQVQCLSNRGTQAHMLSPICNEYCWLLLLYCFLYLQSK